MEIKFNHKSAYTVLIAGVFTIAATNFFFIAPNTPLINGVTGYPVLMAKNIKEVRIVDSETEVYNQSSILIANPKSVGTKQYVQVSLQPEFLQSKREWDRKLVAKPIFVISIISIILGFITGSSCRSKNA